MTRPLVYFAHPVASNTFGTFEANMRRASEWYRLAVLHGEELEVDVVAPWIADVMSFDDSKQEERALAMARNLRFLHRCQFAWTFGPLISPGMADECLELLQRRGRVVDYTHHRLIRPPEDVGRVLRSPHYLGTASDLRELVALQSKVKL